MFDKQTWSNHVEWTPRRQEYNHSSSQLAHPGGNTKHSPGPTLNVYSGTHRFALYIPPSVELNEWKALCNGGCIPILQVLLPLSCNESVISLYASACANAPPPAEPV